MPTYNCVVEIHGEQHFKPSSFGRNKVETINKFSEQVQRDERLRKICIDCDLKYLEISHSDKITTGFIMGLLDGIEN